MMMDTLNAIDKKVSRDIGLRVSQERKARGWSHEELSNRSDYSKKFLVSVELGEVLITAELADNLAKAFGQDRAWLIFKEPQLNEGDKVLVKNTSLKDGVYVARESKDGKYQISFETQPADTDEEEEMGYEGSHYEDAMEALVAMLEDLADENMGATLQLAKAIQALSRAQALIEVAED